MASPSPPDRVVSETGDPLILTPGPVTTARPVKEAMVHDWGPHGAAFSDIGRDVLTRLSEIVNAKGTYTTVPVEGSGSFAVEAMVTTFVPARGKVLVLVNGAHGQRAKRVCELARRALVVHETAEDRPPDLKKVDQLLERNKDVTHVFAVHCETETGILNPIADVAELVECHGRRLLIDAIGTFGALPLNARLSRFDALAASSDVCLEGVSGLGFVIGREAALSECKGNGTTLMLDLYERWQHRATTGAYGLAPPTQVIAALHRALQDWAAEGGRAARGQRYSENARVLIEGMRALGFKTLLPDELQSPIVVAFRMPEIARFDFEGFRGKLAERGYAIDAAGPKAARFRIGCIGRLDTGHLRSLLAAVTAVLGEMGVSDLRSAA
jgi:2-aminoethylphosphonate-pyruvate transaminase